MSAAFTGLSEILVATGYDSSSSSLNDSSPLNDKGTFIHSLPNIASFILLVAVFAAIGLPTEKFRVWPKWKLSSTILQIGFIISFILPLIPAIIPLKYLTKSSGDAFIAADDLANDQLSVSELQEAYTSDVKSQILGAAIENNPGIQNFVAALPVLLSFPTSLIAGSLRIRGLLPDSSLSSWILTTSAPFLSIVVLAAAIIIIQVVGDLTLMFGVFFQCITPWMYVFRRGLYVKAPSEGGEKKIDRNQQIILIMKLLSLALYISWAFTNDHLKSGNALSYTKFILEV